MTDLLIGLGRPLLGHSALDSMSDHIEHQWRQRHQYFDQAPMLSGEWPDEQTHHPSAMQDMDIRMFQQDNSNGYEPSYSGTHARILSPNMTYPPEPWTSDMDIGTPSTAAFPISDPRDGFSDPHSAPALNHLRPPPAISHSGSSHGARKSHGGMSASISPLQGLDRPGIGRSITDPSQQLVKGASSVDRAADTLVKRSGSSDEEDDEDAVLQKEDPKTRGRKRQRIPHTAVERRYRENLNAHLDKLRQAVPALAARKSGSGGQGKDASEGLKPSKCEILSGAIDHIAMLDRENAALRNEVRTLRGTVAEFDAWYRANPR